MENNRKPRDQETRAAEQREVAVADWVPPSLFPRPEPRPGIVYHWVRTMTRGEPDRVNVDRRHREGWSPVKASDCPELMNLRDENSSHPEGIEIAGLLLCQLPAERAKARREYYRLKNYQQMTAVNNNVFATVPQDHRMYWMPPEARTYATVGGHRVAVPGGGR